MAQVLARPRKASRQSRPASLRVPPLIFALGDLAADVVLRAVGVERDFGPVEHHQQFGLVGVQPGEQAVEGDEAGPALEDAVEAGAQGGLARGLTDRGDRP